MMSLLIACQAVVRHLRDAVSSPIVRALSLALIIHFALLAGMGFWARNRPAIALTASSEPPRWLDLSLVPTELPLPKSVEITENFDRSEASMALSPRQTGPLPNNSPPISTQPKILFGTEGENGDFHAGNSSEDRLFGTSAEGSGEGRDDKRTGNGPKNHINLGIDRSLTWMWTQPEKKPPLPRPASSTGGLQEWLDSHDRKLGLGFGGPVAAAFREAVSTPRSGHARFEAIIDGSGRVQDVRVLSVNGDRDAWTAVAQQVRASLQSRLLRTPSGGVSIILAVASRHQLPSGATAGKSIQLKSSGAQFDLSDIGASPTHQVTVQVLSERRL